MTIKTFTITAPDGSTQDVRGLINADGQLIEHPSMVPVDLTGKTVLEKCCEGDASSDCDICEDVTVSEANLSGGVTLYNSAIEEGFAAKITANPVVPSGGTVFVGLADNADYSLANARYGFEITDTGVTAIGTGATYSGPVGEVSVQSWGDEIIYYVDGVEVDRVILADTLTHSVVWGTA